MQFLKWSGMGIMGLSAMAFIAGAVPPQSAKPLSDVLHNVEAQGGYTALTEASFDDGVWEIEALHQGKPVEIHVNPDSAKVVSEHPEQAHAKVPKGAKSLSAIVKQLEQAGYAIESVDFERTGWEAEVVRDRQERELILDVKTGKVLSDRADD